MFLFYNKNSNFFLIHILFFLFSFNGFSGTIDLFPSVRETMYASVMNNLFGHDVLPVSDKVVFLFKINDVVR